MPETARLAAALAGRYHIERELGAGGMATVYAARDLKHQREVALKVLRPELAVVLGAERFLHEIQITAGLDHPHILTLIDSGEAGGLLYYVLPLVRGESLRHRLQQERQLSVDEALTITRQIAGALEYAHRRGVVHRDIKPENILLHEGEAMLTDFGIALAVREAGGNRLTESGLSLGTPQYMSPEQATGDRELDARSDIYSLGAVLYEMLAGEPPVTGPTAQAVIAKLMTERPTRLKVVRDTVPEGVDNAVARALAKVPADRFKSAGEFAAALTIETITPTDAPVTMPSKRRRRPVVLMGSGIVLLLLIAALVLIFQRTPETRGTDPNLIAVAPFDLVSATPELAVWSEGIVDVVARYFDGAGTLRAVAPTRAIRAWSGRADRESATRFGQALDAGYVVYGQLVGSDSVRLTATLYDVAASRALDEHEWRGTARGIDRLADSLSTRFLDVLGRTRQLGNRRTDPIGTANPLAIRSFLSGMRDLRRAAYGDAARHFTEAVSLDTGFVLGRLYAVEANAWFHGVGDSGVIRMALEAAARNQGLTRRDSLLVVADSIRAAIYQGRRQAPPFFLVSRLKTVMDTLLTAFPDDPEVVYWVTDANHHFNSLGKSERWHLEGFRHAIELDSLFAPAYVHAVGLSAMLDPPDATRALIRGMLAVPQVDSVEAQALQLADRLLDSTIPPGMKQRALDSAPEPVFLRAQNFVEYSPDSIGIMAARTRARRFPQAVPSSSNELVGLLLYHGRLYDALALLPAVTSPTPRNLYARELASFGIIPLQTFDSLNHMTWDSPNPMAPVAGLPLWIASRDSVRLIRFYNRLDRARNAASPSDRASMDLVVGFARAAVQVARGDSSGFRDLRIPEWLPPGMRAETPFGLWPVEMLLALHREDEAWTLLQSRGSRGTVAVLWMLYRARLAEKRGEREIALDDYGFVARLWANADEPLRSFAREAREGLARLSGEP
jgi:TolB-like protein